MSSYGALPAPMPAGITRELLGTSLRFTYRWYSLAAWGLLAFCVFWDGFLVFWYTAALGFDGPKGSGGPGLFFLLFPLIHVGVGIGMTYYALCSFVNRTIVDVSPREIRIAIGPLPWRGNHAVAPMQVAQIYREEIVRHTKNGQKITYQLSAALKDGKKLKLLSGLAGPDQALYLEQEIERHLGIRDQPVAGEMRK